ncbi:hypothetical protein BN12_280011 [Nostocoides japonicum T1-X7]|uniref:Uncharacterized protein n=1 Tax=Nostocoides japonicum T1-X7 TaxID=1194083 RepID=A0A077M2A5_9MICO|nr:hypothetical protein BN12_280011 [Tetrasphaera japonica T1-X7]
MIGGVVGPISERDSLVRTHVFARVLIVLDDLDRALHPDADAAASHPPAPRIHEGCIFPPPFLSSRSGNDQGLEQIRP